MNPIIDGGAAFPCAEVSQNGATGETITHQWSSPGLTIRDYLAIHSGANDLEMSPESAEVLMGRPAPAYTDDLPGCLRFWAEVRSKLRYIEADAMIAERGAS